MDDYKWWFSFHSSVQVGKNVEGLQVSSGSENGSECVQAENLVQDP